ncbi:MAG: cobyrinate a,c-diamide synthase [[Eubacterium] rectale]|nr:cobyrinate a,c-diamide synthase [Agathobacter rectalis]
MKINRFMIAAPKSGSGKTMITCALLQLLKDSGKNVLSYKCGPDYIDPMFHKKVLGVPSKNLDTFFTDEKTTVQLFLDERADGDFAVLEGVMGLYDGLGGIYELGSSYHLAKVTQTPIILVVDAKGMGKSVIALIAGFLQYDTQHLIKGVLLNRMSKGYYDIIKPLIEKELSVKVVGYFPEQKDIGLSSRHLGLVMPDELSDIKKQLNETADRLKKTIDMDLFIDIAEAADEIGDSGSADVYNEKNIGNCDQNEFSQNKAINTVNIAVAMDEAFCFYYEDNLKLLEKCGAKLQYFSPIHDTSLPKDCDAMLLGGGYPELYAKELSKNVSMLNAIKKAFRAGMPTVAECGGFMYLHTYIHNQNCVFDMAGALDGECHFKGKLVRFGYIELAEKHSNFLPPNEKIKAHEFHYYDSTDNGADCIATKPATGRSYDCVISHDNYWLGFPHLYYPSNTHFAESFVRKAYEYRRNKNGKLL